MRGVCTSLPAGFQRDRGGPDRPKPSSYAQGKASYYEYLKESKSRYMGGYPSHGRGKHRGAREKEKQKMAAAHINEVDDFPDPIFGVPPPQPD